MNKSGPTKSASSVETPAVRVEAHNRDWLEWLCRYTPGRPSGVHVKTSWRDCAAHLAMPPLEVIQRRVEVALCGMKTG